MKLNKLWCRSHSTYNSTSSSTCYRTYSCSRKPPLIQSCQSSCCSALDDACRHPYRSPATIAPPHPATIAPPHPVSRPAPETIFSSCKDNSLIKISRQEYVTNVCQVNDFLCAEYKPLYLFKSTAIFEMLV